MIVRRFAQWLTALLSRLTRRVFARASAGAARPNAVTAAVQPLRISNWLADGRRLRPARAVPMTQIAGSRERAVASRPRGGDAGLEQVGAGRLRPQGTAPSTPPPAHGERTIKQPSPQTAPQSQPLPAEPSLPALARTSEEYALRRQLQSFKQLVRLGIYNEGFSKDSVPEQYARSLELGEDASEDAGQN